MNDVTIKINGVSEVARKLYQFSDKLGNKITVNALKEGALLMKKRVKNAAPKNTGRLRRAIMIRKSKLNNPKKNGKVGYFLTIRRGRSRKDLKGAYYASFLENGYNKGSRIVSHASAISQGLTTRQALNERTLKLKQRRRNSNAKVVFRAGGKPVKPLHFVKNSFESTKTASAKAIIQYIEIAGKQLAARI